MRASLIDNGRKVILFLNDITKVKELQKISQKVRSMFLSSVAHELRTPLNSILPMTQMLISILEKPIPNLPQAQKYIKIIMSSSLHLQSVIEDALDMSRIENNKFEVQFESFNP
jgi:signal transduction histidine kinase